MLSDRVRGTGTLILPDSWSGMNAPQCTLRRQEVQRRPGCKTPFRSGGLKLCITLDEFLLASAREAYFDTAIVVIAINTHDRAHAIGRVADAAAEHGIGISTAFEGRASEGA